MACIIIVDDETQVRDVLCQILHTAGHTVAEAPDGRVAMSRLPQVQPDLMILDILMPEKEGLEVIMELRQMASP